MEAELHPPSGRSNSALAGGSVRHAVYRAASAYESMSSVRVSPRNRSRLLKSSFQPNAEVSLGGISVKSSACLLSSGDILALPLTLPQYFSASSKRASELPETQQTCIFRAGAARGAGVYFHRRPRDSSAPPSRAWAVRRGRGRRWARRLAGGRSHTLLSPLASSVAFYGATRVQLRLR